MIIEIFTLCDAATDSAGKLNILGVFDSIYAKEVPAMHPQCALGVRIRFERIERGEHAIQVNIVDTDGASVVPPLKGKLMVQFPDTASSHAFNMVLNMRGLKFEKFGPFAIDLEVDGRQEASLPIFVREHEQSAPEQSA